MLQNAFLQKARPWCVKGTCFIEKLSVSLIGFGLIASGKISTFTMNMA